MGQSHREQNDSWGWGGVREGGGELSKKEKGLMDLDSSVLIAWEKRGIRGLNGNGINTIKIE